MVGYAGGSRRLEHRRWKANSRERSRMHSLNSALDRLRELVPVDATLFPGGGGSAPQKLTKIETLRLAINYMAALQTTLEQGKLPDQTVYCRQLSRGLSQQTAQLIAASLRLSCFKNNSSTENGILSINNHYDESTSTMYPRVFGDNTSNCKHHHTPDGDMTSPHHGHAHWSSADGQQYNRTSADRSISRDYYINSGYQMFY